MGYRSICSTSATTIMTRGNGPQQLPARRIHRTARTCRFAVVQKDVGQRFSARQQIRANQGPSAEDTCASRAQAADARKGDRLYRTDYCFQSNTLYIHLHQSYLLLWLLTFSTSYKFSTGCQETCCQLVILSDTNSP